MQCHINRKLIDMLWAMREAGRPLRERIEEIKRLVVPDDAREILEKRTTSTQEFEVFESGYWIGWEVDRTDPAETVIRIVSIDPL